MFGRGWRFNLGFADDLRLVVQLGSVLEAFSVEVEALTHSERVDVSFLAGILI
jgi:hypothetical protein